MSTVMTYFDATVDGKSLYLRPWFPYEVPGRNYEQWYSMIAYRDDFLAVDQSGRIYQYGYTTRLLRPSVTGEYTIDVDSADGMDTQTEYGWLKDSQLWLYDTSFDPANPLVNLIAANEDVTYDGNEGWNIPRNWLSHLPDMSLVAGHTYVAVVSISDLTSPGTAHLSIAGPGSMQVSVPGAPDNTAPIVGTVGVPEARAYGIGDQLEFTIGLDEAVTVDTAEGTPALLLAIGGQTVQAHYAGGSGSAVLTFRFTLASGQGDAQGIAVTELALNGGRIRDAAGNHADLTLRGVGDTSALVVDTAAPAVQSITVAQAAPASVSYTVTFSESVTGVDGGDFTVTPVGGASGHVAEVVSVDGKTWTVTVDGLAGAGALRLDLKGTGTGIEDAAGNAIAAGFADGQLQDIDLVLPAVATVGAPADGTYTVGQHLDFTITLDEAVIVDTADGIPRLALTIGGQAAGAEYHSGSGTATLVFRHTVAPDDNGSIEIGVLSAGGGTMKDVAGNDAVLSLAGRLPPLAAVLVDSGVPDTGAPVFVSAMANDRTLVLTCADAGALDAAHAAPPGAFTVKADGVNVDVSSVAIDADARTVTLTLGTALRREQAVTVAYTDPSGGNDAYAIQDMAGNDAATLAAMPVENATPPEPTPPVPIPPVPIPPVPIPPEPTPPVPIPPEPTPPEPTPPEPTPPEPTPPEPTPPVEPAPGGTSMIDGVLVRIDTVTGTDGSLTQVVTIPVVTAGRVEQVGDADVADIPLVRDGAGAGLLTAQVPLGFGLQAAGAATPAPAALTGLVDEIRAHTADGSADQVQLTGAGSGFIGSLDGSAPLLVRTIVPTAAPDAAPGTLRILGQPATPGHVPTALVIDARALPPGSSITLDDVEFAVVIGAVRIVSGAGAQIVWGDSAAQQITLGAGDDELHGGAGDDILGSASGSDLVFGDEGNDIVYGGRGNDTIDGGSGNDIVQLSGAGRSDYSFRVADGQLVIAHRDGGTDGTDVVAHVETLRFLGADTSVAGTVARLAEAFTGAPASVATQDAMTAAVAAGASLSQVAHALYGQAGAATLSDDAAFVALLYRHALDRMPDAAGLAYWLDQLARGAARADVALAVCGSDEKLALPTDLAFGATDVATLVRLYSALYDRAPDEGGLNFWLGAHEAGMSMAAIADAFVAGAEGGARYGAVDDAAFTAALYRTALHREAGTAEARYWTDLLASGRADRGDVLLAFADSAEKVALVGTMSTSIDSLHG